MANFRGLLESLVGKEVGTEVRGGREVPFERVIPSPDGTKRFFFRASEGGKVLTIALQAVNPVGGWGDIFDANEIRGEEDVYRYMVRVMAATRGHLTSESLQVYGESGERREGMMWGYGPGEGEAECMVAAGHFPEETLPETILTNATVAAFLQQVRTLDFSTPRFVEPASGETSLSVPSFRDLLT